MKAIIGTKKMGTATMNDPYLNKKILVTGATGSIGRALVRNLLQHNPSVIRLFSNDENAQFDLEQELKLNTHLRFFVGDIRDKERLYRAIEGIDIVFHAAALKHVSLCEYNPFEAVKTNVIGTQNLLEVATDEEVEKLITISTDKAVNPVNVMGATKLLAERLTIAANYYKGTRKTIMSCVRFGNVLSSRGSVIPLFRRQIQQGGPVTLTDPYMVRFVMSIRRATELVLKSAQIAKGGEIFIFKMPALQVQHIAEVMIEKLAQKYGYDPVNIKIEIIGKRNGEKTYEDLMSDEEAIHAYETDDMFIIQAFDKQKISVADSIRTKHYTSRDAPKLTKKQVNDLLTEHL